ncbi:DUF3710 domain-containing protein [Corynebacterium liangguodongii]|uniref:DUF3710 domain-containing protein n=1 Tax=Corynebacterium liangguodongii TaxID=2079535 RepID=A0A2S0WEQ5_9CORY|nr:DUF3710 domain-containing protein [Corynebacterium liangguodongii]AWB84142.1 DUF3710 domain-containing protein [Corynebacterium liangguodongii]PWC00153.1 DUF3710 domain-containing protein [Corynebacterium liangguodongii]
MALWPFGKKKSAQPARDAAAEKDDPQLAAQEPGIDAAEAEQAAEPADPVVIAHDAVGGETGPFDGDSVNIDDFDFSDFSSVTLNLGSMRIPLPKESQVQVEMGEAGPKMVHIVTRHGRATPVAFAAPRTGGIWESSSEEIAEGMRSEGMPVRFETGPWGREVVGTGTNGVIRIIGVEGPRWLYRVTLAAPTGKEDELAQLGRELVGRSFIYRGADPILAGNSLPVVLPAQLAQQVQQAVIARNAQQGGDGARPEQATVASLSEALGRVMEENARQEPGTR